MPAVKKVTKKRLFLYPEKELYSILEANSKMSCVSMNEYCLNLLTRGLLAEDVETIRTDLKDVVGKISKSGGMNKNEQNVLMEILANMRMNFAENNPSNVSRAKDFAKKYTYQLSMDDGDEQQ